MADQPSGRELGRRIFAALQDYVARSLGSIAQQLDVLQRSVAQLAREMPTLDLVRGEMDAVVSKLELPRGEKGESGTSVTLNDVMPAIEAMMSRSLLEFERNLQERFDRAVQNIPRPKDGASVETFQAVSDGRRFMLGVRVGGQDFVQEFKLDLMQWKGVYRSGQRYEKSDIVTYSGSAFIAVEDVGPNDKPEASNKWVLFVKRGRDGKDAGDDE